MALQDKESIEERNEGLREGNRYYQSQTEALARSLDLSNSLLDTLKEDMGIRTRRRTEDQNLLELNKKINKEIVNQRVGLNTVNDIEKQITKNKKFITAADTLTVSLTNQILTSGKQNVAVIVETANELAQNLVKQKENQILIDEINKEIANGNALRADQLTALEDSNTELDNEIDTAYSLLDTDGKRLAITQAQSIALEANNVRRGKEKDLVEELNDSLGVTGKILNLFGSIPGLGKDAQDAYAAVVAEQKALVEDGQEIMSQEEAIIFGAKKLGEGIGKTLSDPLTVGLFLFREIGKAITEVDSRVTGLQKQLGLSRITSAGISFDFKQLTFSTSDAFITTQKLYESFAAFSEELGFAVDYSGQTLETFTTLNKRLGLSTKEAASLTTLLKLQGDNTEDQLGNLTKQIGAFNTINGKAFDTKQTLNEIASTSASIQVSLKLSAEDLATAVLESRKLGLNLEQVDKIADSLLQFETSITNELKAELLIGRDINLERARLLAINNDLEGVAKELADQNIGFFEFSNLNRIQQQAIAEAMGMSRDEMSQMLLNQQRQLMTNEEISSQLEGQELSNFKQLTFQESLNTALEKMRDIFSTIAEGPLGMVAGFFADILSNSYAVNAILGAITITLARQAFLSGATLAKSIGIAIASIYSKAAGLGPVGFALAGGATAALLTAVAKSSATAQSVEDGIAPSSKGPFTIMDNYGGMAVTTQGDNLVATPNINNSPVANNDEQRRTNMLLEKLLSKDSNVYMDSQRVGTALSMGKSRL